MRPNWVDQHPSACTCTACDRNRRSSGNRVRGKSSRPRRSTAKQGHEERIHRECEVYLEKLCRQFNVRQPLLIFDDNLQNPGACGEAGQSTIWVQRGYFLRENRGERERVLRHELAHISVHNTPGMRDAEAHGPEFKREVARLGGDSAIGAMTWYGYFMAGAVLWGGLLAGIGAHGWAYGDGLPLWLVSELAPLGIPQVAPNGWASPGRIAIVVGSVLVGLVLPVLALEALSSAANATWRAVLRLVRN